MKRTQPIQQNQEGAPAPQRTTNQQPNLQPNAAEAAARTAVTDTTVARQQHIAAAANPSSTSTGHITLQQQLVAAAAAAAAPTATAASQDTATVELTQLVQRMPADNAFEAAYYNQVMDWLEANYDGFISGHENSSLNTLRLVIYALQYSNDGLDKNRILTFMRGEDIEDRMLPVFRISQRIETKQQEEEITEAEDTMADMARKVLVIVGESFTGEVLYLMQTYK